MSEYFERLGKLLSKTLETGEIPQEKEEIPENNIEFSYKKEKKRKEFPKKEQIPVGEVIKLHKYTKNMQFPSKISKALSTLDIAYSFTIKDITKQYHKLLKENHPDTKITIQTSENVLKNRQINDIQSAYLLLKSYFGKM